MWAEMGHECPSWTINILLDLGKILGTLGEFVSKLVGKELVLPRTGYTMRLHIGDLTSKKLDVCLEDTSRMLA